MTNELMPEGQPMYTSVVKYPTISSLVETEGKKKMLAVLVLLVKDFCSSVNVVRNMNEDQMIEAGSMLLEECGNFRMEDYVMMFTMAKRGALSEVKIMDRIDIQVISTIMDAYWQRRSAAGRRALEDDVDRIESMGDQTRLLEKIDPGDRKMIESVDGLAGAIDSIKANFTKPIIDEAAAKNDVHRPDVSYEYGTDEKGNVGFKKKGNG